jgi:hypothetical protein
VEYVTAGPRRFAGLATAICTASSIPTLLTSLSTRVTDGDDWWAQTKRLRDDNGGAWIRELRRAFQRPAAPTVQTPDTVDAGLASELAWRAPQGTVSTFTSDHFGRAGWKVKLSDDVVEDAYFTVPLAVARAYAASTIGPDGRHLDAVFPRYLGAMRMLAESATATFGARDGARQATRP